jgi:hypothetical protein
MMGRSVEGFGEVGRLLSNDVSLRGPHSSAMRRQALILIRQPFDRFSVNSRVRTYREFEEKEAVYELSSFAVIGVMRSRNRPGWILCVPTVFATEFCVSPRGAIERYLPGELALPGWDCAGFSSSVGFESRQSAW